MSYKLQSRTKLMRQMLNFPIPFQSPLTLHTNVEMPILPPKGGQASLRHKTQKLPTLYWGGGGPGHLLSHHTSQNKKIQIFSR